MKKFLKSLVLILFLISSLCVLVGCHNADKQNLTYLIIDGDINGECVSINLSSIQQENYTYQSEGVTVSDNGWSLEKLLLNVSPIYEQNQLFITAKDGTSALIDLPLAGKIYLFEENKNVSVKTNDYARHVNIKNIKEITLVAKEPTEIISGIKIVHPVTNGQATYENDKVKRITWGNVKLKMFNWDGVNNEYNGIKSYKYSENKTFNLSGLTDKLMGIAYFEDFDILKNAGNLPLIWKYGKAYMNCNNAEKALYGIVTDTLTANFDAFIEMKECLDNNQRIMFILPDGLSWQQVSNFSDNLNLLKPQNEIKNGISKTVALSTTTNIAKSEVALASIITGKSPYITGIIKKNGATGIDLGSEDIFTYAKKLGWEAQTAYIEGNRQMLKTGIEAVITFPDENGDTDREVYLKTRAAIDADNKFIFAHFHGIDDINHKYGPISTQALAKVQETETRIADLISKFDGKVIIVSDHGHYNCIENGLQKGNHGTFCNLDMYLPFYIIENGKVWSKSA